MALLISQEEFFEQYGITLEYFEKTGLIWSDLEEIFDDYIRRYDELDRAASPLFNTLIKIENVHSVRYRIKDPEHVIEKIIRKKHKNPKRIITKENYIKDLTDLIGLRAIHLFKDEWRLIHNTIRSTWNLKEKPVYYFREGDKIDSKEEFKERGCSIALHPKHYRSVHYIIKTNPTKQEYFAEIQVRTLFEEGWSEIDHKVNYPHLNNNQTLIDMLSILNRLAGSADEMGTIIKNLPLLLDELKRKEEDNKHTADEVNLVIDNNEALSIPEKEKLKKGVLQLQANPMEEALRALTSNSAIFKLGEAIKLDAATTKKMFDEINSRGPFKYRRDLVPKVTDSNMG